MNKYVSLRMFVDKNDKLSFRTYEYDSTLYFINDTNEIEMLLNKDELAQFETTVKQISIKNNWREVGSRVVDISNIPICQKKTSTLLKA